MDYCLRKLISAEEIARTVEDLANQIDADFKQGKDLLLVGLLKGSVIFLSDLARAIQQNAGLDFMVVSSYGQQFISSRDVRILKDLDEDIYGRDVIIVEDVVDTGFTIGKILQMLKTRKPHSLKVCSLLDKPKKREVSVEVDYVGKVMGDEFVVGYGMDFGQKYRTLRDIHEVVFKKEEMV